MIGPESWCRVSVMVGTVNERIPGSLLWLGSRSEGALTDSSLIIRVSCYLDSRVFVTKRGQLVQRGKGKERERNDLCLVLLGPV